MPEEVNDRAELEAQILELRDKLARQEGHQEGVERVLRTLGVVATILGVFVGLGVFTFVNNSVDQAKTDLDTSLKEAQTALENSLDATAEVYQDQQDIFYAEKLDELNGIFAERDANIVTRDALLDSIYGTRQAELLDELSSDISQSFEDIRQEAENEGDVRATEIAANSETIILDSQTRVFEAVSDIIDQDKLNVVAIELVQTRVNQSFEESVQRAVQETLEAPTATPTLTPTATLIPRPTATP